MKFLKLHQIAILAFTLLLSSTTWATVPANTLPTTSPYNADPQNLYVQDATSQGIGNVNMILCIMNGMGVSASGMLNNGAYVALIDINKCQSQGGGSSSGGSTSAGASSATNFMKAIINATRADNSSPMVADVWMSMTQMNNGQPQSQEIYVKVTATSSPADVPPYGVFRMDFVGYPKGTTAFTTANQQMNGYLISTSSNMQYYEADSGGQLSKLTMTAGTTTSGSGTIYQAGNNNGSPTTTTFNFNYTPADFRRSDGTNDQCFDRSLSNAQTSIWQYGTYNSTDGTRVDLANPSFPITAVYGGTTYYGFASYYGINFQGLDLSTITGSTTPISGLVVTDGRSGNSTTYNMSMIGGSLTKWTQNRTTLDAMDGIPFTFNGDLTGQTTGSTNSVNAAISSNNNNGYGNWQMQWNSTGTNAGKFTVVGMQSCSNNGCALTTFTSPVVVTGTNFNTQAISGWSNSFGGSLNIPNTGSAHVKADAVSYYSQSNVVPGSASEPTTLYCLSNCPDATSITAANSYSSGSGSSPYNTATKSQWFSASSAANTVTYTFGASGLVSGSTAMTITNSKFLNNSNNKMFSNGMQTGMLFDATATGTTGFATCSQGVCQPNNPTAYYTWSTGTNQWNQSMWLTKTSNSSVVAFDPPQNISYTVPTGSTYGTWAGKTIVLQFDGFGNLQGIPSICVSPVDNSQVDCTTSNSRWVTQFSIPDGATMTLPASGSTAAIPLIVKALNGEERLTNLGSGATTAACSGMSIATQTLPDATQLHNMALSTDSFYIGTKPTPSSSVPKIIDGVAQ